LAFHMFAHDHNGAFPMAVPARLGGSLEFVQNAYRLKGEFFFAFRHFQALSNEMVTPRLLICPADYRLPSSSFGALQNENVSYFVGVKADYLKPSTILAGDRNITNDWVGAASVLQLGPNNFLRWTHELHRFKGNLLLADGSVEGLKNLMLATANNQSTQPTDLVLPSLKSSMTSGNPLPAGHTPPGADIARATNKAELSAPASRKPPTVALVSATETFRKTQTAIPTGPEQRPSAKPKDTSTNHVTPTAAPKPSGQQSSNSISGQVTVFASAQRSSNVSVWPFLLLLFLLLALILLLELRRRVHASKKLSMKVIPSPGVEHEADSL